MRVSKSNKEINNFLTGCISKTLLKTFTSPQKVCSYSCKERNSLTAKNDCSSIEHSSMSYQNIVSNHSYELHKPTEREKLKLKAEQQKVNYERATKLLES